MTDDALRRTTCALAVLGIGVAGYLTYIHYAGLTPVCGISHGCETVQTSRYSTLLHTPVALLGLITYAFVFATSFSRSELAMLSGFVLTVTAFAFSTYLTYRELFISRSELAMLSGFVLTVTAFAFSTYLTYRELFTIHAICSWCVSSAIIFTLLAIVTTARLTTRRPATVVLPTA